MRSNEPDTDRWLRGPRTKTEDDIEARLQRGLQQVMDYVSFTESNDFVIKDIDDFTLAVEVPFEIEIGGVLVKGAIDQILLLPDGVEVRDLKSGNREAGKLQLGIYALAVEKIFRWPVKKASFFYAKDSKIVTVSRQELDRYNEDYLSELLSALDRGIENGVFIPNPSSSCTLCSVKMYCRELGDNPKPLSFRKVVVDG